MVTASWLVSPSVGFAATADWSTGASPHVWVTADFVHWTDITPPAMTGVVDDVYSLDSRHVWATVSSCALGGGTETIWASADGGVSWSWTAAGGHSCSAGSTSVIRFRDAGHGWVVDLNPTGPVAYLLVTDDGEELVAAR